MLSTGSCRRALRTNIQKLGVLLVFHLSAKSLQGRCKESIGIGYGKEREESQFLYPATSASNSILQISFAAAFLSGRRQNCKHIIDPCQKNTDTLMKYHFAY